MEINFCSLTQSESLHPLGGRWRVAPDEGYLGQNAAVLRPHQSPAVTAVPLFVTFGDISPRRGENLSLPGEAFIRKIDFRGCTPPVACGDSPLGDGAFGMAMHPLKPQGLPLRQRLPWRGSRQNRPVLPAGVCGKEKRAAPEWWVQLSAFDLKNQTASSVLAVLPASSFCLKRPLALKPGMEVDSRRLETLVLGLV